MNRIFGRYPQMNRGLVLLVTLLLPPTTAEAVLHALARERTALVAPHTVEARPAAESSAPVAEADQRDEAEEPSATIVSIVAPPAPLPVFFATLAAPAPAPSLALSLRAALLRPSAPRAPPVA